MNKITQHRPAFFEGFDNEVNEFSTTEELLNIPFVKTFGEEPDFFQYSVSPRTGEWAKSLLMAEYKNGTVWWVVGRLDSLEGITLPEWEPPSHF